LEDIDYLFATPEVKATMEMSRHGLLVRGENQDDAEARSEMIEKIPG
jgi:hypothetical protein